jgi:hypothetical protein
VATTGRFGMYSRTGGSFQGVSVDDLNIVTTTPITARGGTVSFDGNNVVYTAPTNQCGPDAFYYLVSDGQSGGSLVDQVNITVYPSNNTAPTIVACAANQTVAVGASCLAALPDLTSSLVVTDSCCCVVITQSPAAGTMAGLGTTTVTLTVSNVVGLIATCQAYVTNVDTTAPIITACQSDLTVECTGGGAHVLYTVTASDNCSTPLVNCTPLASGALFPLGMTTVTCTASDASGNVSAACVFNVTVADTTPPNITCVANKTVQCGTAWTFDKPTALDACGTNVIHIVDTVTNSACGNTFSATRTWNATDDSGNTSANCSQTVTVVDTTPPVIACSANLTNDCTSVAGAVVTFTTTATDTCDASPNVVCVPASGSTFALGVTTVNCTATDICGNHSGCSFTVTVKDAAGPPTLTIVRSGATAVISWPATCTTYTLQQASDLGTWSNSGAVVTLVSGHYQATVSDNTGYTFYRLKNP